MMRLDSCRVRGEASKVKMYCGIEFNSRPRPWVLFND